MNEGAATLWVGVVSCAADFLCTILPIPVVLRLRMPLRQRIGVCVLLSAGILVTVAGIVRTWFIYKSLIATYDETWFTYPLWICAALEIDIAVVSHESCILYESVELICIPDMCLCASHEKRFVAVHPQVDLISVQQLLGVISRF
jgi:hypothetical protein